MKSQTVESIKILIACFTIYFLYGGATRLVAIFYVESIQLYGINRKQASFPFVLAFLGRNFCGPLYGYLQQIFGIKFLVIFGNIVTTISIGACFFAHSILTITILWGIIFGFSFGLGTQYLPSLINAHFTTHRSKANAFTYSGACCGGIVLPPIIDICVQYYGLNGSFLILAGIMAHLIPVSFLLKSKEQNSEIEICKIKIEAKKCGIQIEENGKQDLKIMKLNELITDKGSSIPISIDSKKFPSTEFINNIYTKTHHLNMTNNETSKSGIERKPPSAFTFQNFKIFLDLPFLNMLVMTAGNTFVTTTMWTIILDYVRDKGVGASLEIYYVIIIPFADIFGRMVSGFVIDKKFLPNALMTSICCVSTGLTLIGLLLVSHYLILMFFVFLFPLFYGSVMILQIALIQEFINPEESVMAMSSRFILYGIINLAISPMIGYFREEHGSYDGVIFTLTGISIFCGFIAYFIPHLTKRRQKSVSNNII